MGEKRYFAELQTHTKFYFVQKKIIVSIFKLTPKI